MAASALSEPEQALVAVEPDGLGMVRNGAYLLNRLDATRQEIWGSRAESEVEFSPPS